MNKQSEKPVVKIKNWTLIHYLGTPTMFGDVIDHYRIGSKEAVRTSKIVAIHKDINKVETQNTMYQLVGKGECRLAGWDKPQ